MINHFIPKNLSEALDILSNHDCYIIAGGTDLMVQKHRSSGLLPTFEKDVLYISNLEELNFIRSDDKGVHIGATTKYRDISSSELVPQLLKDVISELASPNIRNMATLAGNIGNASPAGDTLVALYVLDAYLVLQNKESKREILVKDFIKGVRKIDRKPDEMITEIVIPHHDLHYYWKKVGSRAAESISKLSFLGAYITKDGIIKDLRIGFGSVSITVVRNKDIEKQYCGLKIDEFSQQIPEIISKYDEIINPITDQRSTKDYRKKVAMNLLKDFLTKIK